MYRAQKWRLFLCSQLWTTMAQYPQLGARPVCTFRIRARHDRKSKTPQQKEMRDVAEVGTDGTRDPFPSHLGRQRKLWR